MTKKKENILTPTLKKEIKEMTQALVESGDIKADEQNGMEALFRMLYLSAMGIFHFCPKMGEITLSGEMMKAKRKNHRIKKNTNKTREFVVKRKDKKNLELWCVRGVKDDEAFMKLWSKHVDTIAASKAPAIGFLCVGLHEKRLFDVFDEKGTHIYVAAHDEDDAIKMVDDAVDRGHVPEGDYTASPLESIDTVCLYNANKKMDEVFGGIFHATKKRNIGHYSRKFDVLEFDDFRDGRHKEFCCSMEKLKTEKVRNPFDEKN